MFQDEKKVIPDIVGPRIPDLNQTGISDKDEKERKNKLYALIALLLFKPFRNISDIIEDHGSFDESFREFQDSEMFLSGKGPRVLENMQEYYESKERATSLGNAEKESPNTQSIEEMDLIEKLALENHEQCLNFEDSEKEDSEKDIENTELFESEDECAEYGENNSERGDNNSGDEQCRQLVLVPIAEQSMKKKFLLTVDKNSIQSTDPYWSMIDRCFSTYHNSVEAIIDPVISKKRIFNCEFDQSITIGCGLSRDGWKEKLSELSKKNLPMIASLN